MKKLIFDLDIYSHQIDYVGQVNNAVYINWMEIGWLKMLDVIGLPFSTLIDKGSIPALLHTTIAYKSPLFSGDRVWVETWLSAIGYRSVVVCFNFYNAAFNTNTVSEQVLVAEGYQKNMFVDKNTLKSRLFTREEKKAFLPYLKEEPIGETNLLPRQPRSPEIKRQTHSL
jgi:acyl-CoA thioester hydrolase